MRYEENFPQPCHHRYEGEVPTLLLSTYKQMSVTLTGFLPCPAVTCLPYQLTCD